MKAAAALFALFLFLMGCNAVSGTPIVDDASSDATASNMDATLVTEAAAPTDDGGTSGDARGDVAPGDAHPDGCPSGEVVPDAGDTCAGFGRSDSCDPACGVPPYGYVCTNGGPPGFSGCLRVSNSAVFGGTYCCPDLKCVRVASKDSVCADAGLALRLYQCATASDGGLLATPAAGCTEVTGLPAYRYFCC